MLVRGAASKSGVWVHTHRLDFILPRSPPYDYERDSDVAVDRRAEITSRRPALYGSSSGQVASASSCALDSNH